MIKTRIICIGKHQKEWLKKGILEYEKKIQLFCRIEWVICKESNYKKGNLLDCIKAEEVKLQKHIHPRHISIICDENGSSLSSADLALKFKNWTLEGFSQVNFFIGGAYGLGGNIRNQGNLILSFSKFTLNHQIFRILLLEQIYRSFTILSNQAYHH